MPLFLVFALLWGLVAGGMLAMPERFHWPMAWALIGTGIPLLGLMTFQAGPIFGLAGLAIAVILLARAIRAYRPTATEFGGS